MVRRLNTKRKRITLAQKRFTRKHNGGSNIAWLKKYTGFKNLTIINIEGNGDCFFAALRDSGITDPDTGKSLTVKELRSIVSDSATEEQFNQYKTLYQTTKRELENLKGEYTENMYNIEYLEKSGHKGETIQYLYNENERLKTSLMDANELYKDFEWMENINNLEELKTFIMSSKYWADMWSIDILTEYFNILLIIFDKELNEKSQKGIVCNIQQEIFDKRPSKVILMIRENNHYQLIKNAGKRYSSTISPTIQKLLKVDCGLSLDTKKKNIKDKQVRFITPDSSDSSDSSILSKRRIEESKRRIEELMPRMAPDSPILSKRRIEELMAMTEPKKDEATASEVRTADKTPETTNPNNKVPTAVFYKEGNSQRIALRGTKSMAICDIDDKGFVKSITYNDVKSQVAKKIMLD